MKARSSPRTDAARILVVDDHARARESMADILRHADYEVACCASGVEALNYLRQQSVDVVLTDLQMPGMNGIEFIREAGERNIDAQIVMVTAHATVSAAVEAMRHGAFDFIEKPFTALQLEQLVARALTAEQVVQSRPQPSAQVPSTPVAMIGTSDLMKQLRQRIQTIAPTDETVLIQGESGTGKELVARNLHAASKRHSAPLVSFNCPALSPQLMESELFGHERGAFTGAESQRVGRFELADHGTVLLDEVTEIENGLQSKLLRVLQERCFERVGSSETRRVDVRVLATTNRDLSQQVERGEFRQDLYYRLAVLPIRVPPLRDRKVDVPELAEHFFEQVAQRLQRDPCRLAEDAVELLTEYHWPGNVRELENIITRASVLSQDATIGADQLRPWLMQGQAAPQRGPSDNGLSVGMSLQDMERQLIEATLQRYDGHRAKTAQALGIGVRTLTNKLRSYGYAPRAKTAAA